MKGPKAPKAGQGHAPMREKMKTSKVGPQARGATKRFGPTGDTSSKVKGMGKPHK